MAANFPTTIWDGDSGNRDSDINMKVAPDYRDWIQVIYEVAAVQDYVLNSDILLGTRYIYFGPTPEASLHYASLVVELNLAESGTNDFRIGDGTNYIQIDSTGVMTLAGTAKRKLTLRPAMDEISQVALSKPTQVTIGTFKGYSFPIYNNDNEEIFYELRIPYRWNGESDPQICMLVALADTEDVGDRFKFRCSWEHVKEDGTLSADVHDVDVEKIILVSHTAQYSIYSVHFLIDHDIHGAGNEIEVNDTLGFRVRRIASSGTAIDNEVIVFDVIVEFIIDKIFDTWTRP